MIGLCALACFNGFRPLFQDFSASLQLFARRFELEAA
jgi:hypothetical protein